MRRISKIVEGRSGVLGILVIIYFTVLSTGSSVHHLNALKIFCFIVAVSVVFLLHLLLMKRGEIFLHSPALLFLLFWAVSSLSLLWPGYRYDARIYAAILFATFLFLILIGQALTNNEEILFFLKGVALLLFIQMILGILEGTRAFWFYGRALGQRIITSLGNPNYLAGVLILLLPLAAAAGTVLPIRSSGARSGATAGKMTALIRSPLPYWTAVAGGTVLLIFTQCRGAWLGYAAGVLCFCAGLLFLAEKGRRKKLLRSILLLIFAVLILVVLLLLTVPSLRIRVFSTLSQLFSGDTRALLGVRFIAWDTAFKMWTEDLRTILLGQGSGGYYANHFRNLHPDFGVITFQSSFKHAHNEYLEILADGGLFSLLTWLGLVGWSLYRTVRTFLSRTALRFNRVLALGIFCSILAMLIHTFFSLVMRTMAVNMIFFLLIGLAEANGRMELGTGVQPGVENKWLSRMVHLPLPEGRKRCLIAVLCLILFSVPVGYSFRYIMAEHTMMKGYRAESVEDSIRWFKRSLQWNSRNIYALYELMWLKSDKPEENLAFGREIEGLIPGYRRTTWVIGANQVLIGDYEEAERSLNRYRAQNRFDDETYLLLLHVHIRAGNKPAVEEVLRDLIVVRDKYMMRHIDSYQDLEDGQLEFTEAAQVIRVFNRGNELIREVGRGYLNQVAGLLLGFREAPFEVVNARINLGVGSLFDELAYGDAGAPYYMGAFKKGAISEGEREFIYNKILGYYKLAEESLAAIRNSEDKGSPNESAVKKKVIRYLEDLLTIQPDGVMKNRLIELTEEE